MRVQCTPQRTRITLPLTRRSCYSVPEPKCRECFYTVFHFYYLRILLLRVHVLSLPRLRWRRQVYAGTCGGISGPKNAPVCASSSHTASKHTLPSPPPTHHIFLVYTLYSAVYVVNVVGSRKASFYKKLVETSPPSLCARKIF